MSIHFTCGCGKEYTVKEELAGKRAKCERCGNTVRVPARSEDQPPNSLFDVLDADVTPVGDPLRSTASHQGGGITLSVPVLAGIVGCAAVASLVVIMGVTALTRESSPSEPAAKLERNGTGMGTDKVGTVASSSETKLRAGPPEAVLGPISEGTAEQLAVTVRTNARGATLSVVDDESREELLSYVLQGRETEHQFQPPRPGRYSYHLRLAGMELDATEVSAAGQVELMFDRNQLMEMCRLATCLVRLPGGGHGSGFLLRDRQTIVTAAHVLATKRLEDIEFVFDPTGAETEEVYIGARMIHSDPEADVAILRLSDPVSDKWPYLWPAAELPATDEVVIDQARGTVTRRKLAVLAIGNPQLGDSYDPLYTRHTTIVGRGPDVMQLDVEFKPGFSGGPLCLVDTGEAVGLISYKLAVPQDYRLDGVTFAKSIRLVNDALANWDRRSPDAQQRELNRLSELFARRYGGRCALMASANILTDADIYARCCVEVANSFLAHIAPLDFDQQSELIKYRLGGAKPATLKAIQDRMAKEREAEVDKYFKNQGAELAARIREKITPQIQEDTEKWYTEAMADTTLSESIKQHLQESYECYSYLKERAERIDTDKRTKDTTPQQFIDELNQKGRDAAVAALKTLELAKEYLQ